MNRSILIAGAGIAGLTAALALHARGFSNIRVIERAHSVQALGSGINLMPVAVREYEALGLLPALEQISIQTRELFYMNPFGQTIWHELKGRHARSRWPQLSIHRGWLQMLLYEETRRRLGPDAVQTGVELLFADAASGAARLRDRHSQNEYETAADLLIGADGIRSALRAQLHPSAAPEANGMVIFRGLAWGASFLAGDSMVIAGNDKHKFVLYPLAHENGRTLLNWAAAAPEDPERGYGRGDWNQRVPSSAFAELFAGWHIAGMDLARLIESSADTFVYPMVDIAPLPSWSAGGKLLLIGDAAHAMYPIGSNGATQSIIDAAALAWHLAHEAEQAQALANFESDRRDKMSQLQSANRRQGPEVVVNLAAQRAPQGFQRIGDVFADGELADVSSRYAAATAMDLEKLNLSQAYAAQTVSAPHRPPAAATEPLSHA